MSNSLSLRLLGTQSDGRLVELARQGHERAFEALVDRYRRPLLGHARRVVGCTARAEDVLQQALLRAWLALERGDAVRDAAPWLHQIVHNTALNAVRGAERDPMPLHVVPAGDVEGPEGAFERRVTVRQALRGIAALPALQREALVQTAVYGRSREEVAGELGLSSGAVRGLAYRARVAVRASMTALTPAPVAAWAAGIGAPVPAGAGAGGILAVLGQAGVAAVGAGAVIAGAAVVGPVHRHPRPIPARMPAGVVAGASATGAGTVLGVSSASAAGGPRLRLAAVGSERRVVVSRRAAGGGRGRGLENGRGEHGGGPRVAARSERSGGESRVRVPDAGAQTVSSGSGSGGDVRTGTDGRGDGGGAQTLSTVSVATTPSTGLSGSDSGSSSSSGSDGGPDGGSGGLPNVSTDGVSGGSTGG